MVSLRHRTYAKTPYESLEWKTPPVEWHDLIQVTKNYPEPALGYLVGSDLWVDEYAVRKDHHAWWDTQLGIEYGAWDDIERAIRFSITPGGRLCIISPELPDADDTTLAYVETLAHTLRIPEKSHLVWHVDTAKGDYQRLEIGDFYLYEK